MVSGSLGFLYFSLELYLLFVIFLEWGYFISENLKCKILGNRIC